MCKRIGSILHRSLPGLFCLAVLLAACAPPAISSPQGAPALTPITVQFAWTHQAQFVGICVADLKGYYAAEGLAVTFIVGGSWVDKLAPVLDGSAQFGVAGADAFISKGEMPERVAERLRVAAAGIISH